MKEAFESDASDAIVDVLRFHSSDPTVQDAAISCLSSFAKNPRYAGRLVEKGIVGVIAETLKSKPTAELRTRVLDLMENVAGNSPDTLLSAGGVEQVSSLLAAAKSSNTPEIVTSVSRVLEKVSKVPGAVARIVESGAVPELLDTVMRPELEEHPDAAENTFRLLDRLSRDTDAATYIRETCGGLEKLANAMDLYKSNDRVCKAGGRVLGKLASGNVAQLVTQMQNPATSTDQRDFLAVLLSSLATEDDAASKIISCGGVPALISTLSSSSTKATAAAARALGRIADSDASFEDDEMESMARAVVSTLATNAEDPDVAAASTSALFRMAQQSMNAVGVLQSSGAVDRVLDVLRRHPDYIEHTKESLSFLEHMCIAGTDTSSLVEKGAVPAVCTVLKFGAEDDQVQLDASRILIYLCADTETVHQIVAQNITARLLANMNHKDPKIAKTTIYLVASLCMVRSSVDAFAAAGGLNRILPAVAKYSGDPEIRDTARELLEALSSEEEVSRLVEDLGKRISSALRSGSESDVSALRDTVTSLSALVVLPHCAAQLADRERIANVASSIQSVATATGLGAQQERLLVGLTKLADAVSHSILDSPSGDGFEAIARSGLVRAILGAAKMHPKMTENVELSLRLADTYAKYDADLVAECGGIEAVVAALRLYPTREDIISTGSDILLKLAGSDAGAVAVARNGGTRQIIQTISANANTKGFEKPMERMLSVLQRVSGTPEGADILRRQDGVNAIIDASSSISATSPAAAASSQVLARLLSPADVSTAIDSLDEISRSAASKKKAAAESVKPVLARIGHISSVGNNASTIMKSEGDVNLTELTGVVIDKMLSLEAPEESESDSKREKRERELEECREILPMAFTAIANLARAAPFERTLDRTIDQVGIALARGIAVSECLDAVRSIAGSSEAAAAAVAASKDGAIVRDIVHVLREQIRDEAVVIATCDALSSMSAFPSCAAAVVGSGAQRVVLDWIDENVDDATPVALRSTVGFLAALARDAPTASTILAMDGIEITRSLLAKASTSTAATATPALLTATVELVSNLSLVGEEAILKLNDAGTFRRIIKAISTSTEYLQDPSCMTRVLELVRQVSTIGSVANDLVQQGVQDLIVAAMNANGTSDRVLAAAGSALRALGTNVDVSVLTSEVEEAARVLENAERFDDDMVSSVASSLQRLGNFMMMEGMVNASNAGAIMAAVSNAVGLMTETELATPDQVAHGIQCVTRLAVMVPDGSLNMREAVEILLDAAVLYGGNPKLAASAVSCFGQLATNKSAATAMLDLNVLRELQELNKRHGSDPTFRAAVEDAIQRITDAAVDSLDALSTGDKSSAALTALVTASAANPERLAVLIDRMKDTPGAEEALWEVLLASQRSKDAETSAADAGGAAGGAGAAAGGAGSGGGAAGGAGSGLTVSATAGATPDAAFALSSSSLQLIRALSARVEAEKESGKVPTFAADKGRSQIVALALANSIAVRSRLTESSSEAERRDALDRNAAVLSLLGASTFTEEGAREFVAAKGIENVLQVLDVDLDDPDTAAALVKALDGLLATAPDAIIAALSNSGDMDLLTAAMERHGGDRELKLRIARLLRAVTRAKGAKDSGITRAIFKRIQAAMAESASDPEIAAVLQDVGAVMEARFSSSAQSKLAGGIATAVEAIRAVSEVQVKWDGSSWATADGVVVGAGGVDVAMETPALVQMQRELASTAELLKGQTADNMVECETDMVCSVIAVMATQARSPEVLKNAGTILSALATNSANCQTIARNGGISAILRAFEAQPDDPDIVRTLVTLMERISRNDEFKGLIVTSGGTEMVIRICNSEHVGTPEIADKCLSILANLAYTSKPYIRKIMECEGVKAIEQAMQRHPRNSRVLENAMCALSNLTWESEENMFVIGQTCADEITNVIRDFPHDRPLVKMALRALGNVSNEDKNVEFVVFEHDAVRKVLSAMRSATDDEELLSLAIEVIGNFAAAEVVRGEGEMSLRQSIHFDDASAFIIETMTANPYSAPIQTASMFALALLLGDETVREELKDRNIVELLIKAIRNHDWDSKLLTQAAELVSYLPPQPCVASFIEASGITLLMQALENHGAEDSLVIEVARAFAVLSAYQTLLPQVHLALMSADVAAVLLGLIEGGLERTPVVEALLAALAGLACAEDAAVTIAEVGMHIVMGVYSRHIQIGSIILQCLRLIDLIALKRENVTLIVQADGINKLMTTFTYYDRDPTVVRQAVATLATISSASPEFAALMKEEGADEVLRLVSEQFAPAPERDEDDAKFGVFATGPCMNIVELLKEDYFGHSDLQEIYDNLIARRIEKELAPLQDNPAKLRELHAAEERWGQVEDEFAEALERARNREAIVRECRGAIHMMDALDGISKSAALTAKAARQAAIQKREEAAVDPLGEYRHLLTAGKLFNVWVKRSKTTFQLLVSEDLDNVVWQEPDTQSKKGSVPVSSIVAVKEGTDPKHHGARADPELCLYLESPAGTVLALEAINKGSKRSMADGFNHLIRYKGLLATGAISK